MPDDRMAQIEGRIDRQISGAIAFAGAPRGEMMIAPKNMGELLEFAKMMSVSGVAVPTHLRANPGACLAIALQAFRWGADPFAVGNKSYSVNDRMAYESQLIHAIVTTSPVIARRLRAEYSGEGQQRRCKVIGWIIGEDKPFEYESPTLAAIPIKNSPLWKNDPDQQLFYYASRGWARRWVPEVILGISAPEEVRGEIIDMDPASVPPPPQLEDFEVGPPGEPTYIDTGSQRVDYPGKRLWRRTKARMAAARAAEEERRIAGDQSYEIIDCDGETAVHTDRAMAMRDMLTVAGEAQERGSAAVEAFVENNRDVAAKLGLDLPTLEQNPQDEPAARSRDVPEQPLDSSGVPPPETASHPASAVSLSSQSDVGATIVAKIVPGAVSVVADEPTKKATAGHGGDGVPTVDVGASSTPSKAVPPDYRIEVPVSHKTGRPDWNGWWVVLFLNRLARSKTRDEFNLRVAANADLRDAYYATLAPPTKIAAMAEVDEIKNGLPG